MKNSKNKNSKTTRELNEELIRIDSYIKISQRTKKDFLWHLNKIKSSKFYKIYKLISWTKI